MAIGMSEKQQFWYKVLRQTDNYELQQGDWNVYSFI